MSSEDNNNSTPPPIPNPQPSLNGDRGRRLNISNTLERLEVTALLKEGLTVWMMQNKKVLTFKVKKEGLNETINDFLKTANRNQLDIMTQQGIVYELSTNKYYVEVLQYRTEDDADLREGFGIPTYHLHDFIIDDVVAAQEVVREQDPHAAEVAEQEYTDEGLPLKTVEAALKLDKPQRVRIVGEVHTIKPRFDLIKQIVVNCDNKDCKDKNKHERFNLKSGLMSMGDLPYVFPGGPQAAEHFLKCKTCGKFMEATPTSSKFQSARMVELKHVEVRNTEDVNVSTTITSTAGDVKHIDTLTVRVSGIHTSFMRYGEEIEMIGELLILPAGINSATRPTMQAGIRRRNNNDEIVFAEGMGKYHKIFYADKIKYTNRAKQLNFNPELDTKAIRIFAGFPNLIERLRSMFAVNVIGEELAKEAFLLQAVGPSPKVAGSYYDRFTINIGEFGDVGTAKTLMGMESTKLLPGSRAVLAQHSTSKSIIAVAEKDTDGPWFPRPGPAILANGASIFVDEVGAAAHWDDQDQFLQLMNTDKCPFQKAGIDVILHSRVNWTLASNPSTLNWQNPSEVSKDEIPLKLTILDRLDIILIFRDAAAYNTGTGDSDELTTGERVKEFAYDMVEMFSKHLNLDYIFLKKYIYYVKTSEQFKTTRFENKELVHMLSDTWTEIKKKYPTLIGNRGLGSIFRIASCYARLMLKPTIDRTVVDRTIWFVSEMYKWFGATISDDKTKESTIQSDREKTFLKVCGMVKEVATGKNWFMSTEETADPDNIPFNDVAQHLCNQDKEVSDYLRLRLKDTDSKGRKKIGHNQRLEGIRKELLEKAGKTGGMDFEGGKITVVNNTAPKGLILRWTKNEPEPEGEGEGEPEPESECRIGMEKWKNRTPVLSTFFHFSILPRVSRPSPSFSETPSSRLLFYTICIELTPFQKYCLPSANHWKNGKMEK